MRRTEERARQILFSDPYIEGGGAAVCRSANGTVAVSGAGFMERMKESFRNNLVEEQRWKLMTDGLWVTVRISVLSILAAVIAGIVMCRLRMSRRRIVSSPAGFVIDLLRGIPLLVILMLMFYVVFASSRITGTWVTVMSFGLYYGAYFGEVFRTGMESVDKGQWEAGWALGMGRFQVFRKIALPQALSRIIPVLKGEVIALIKMTSVVGYVAVVDLTKASDIIRSRTLDAFFPLILVSVVYILLAWLTGLGLKALERRLVSKSRGL
jgi:polar amino acid transport system substrate-binding protein